MRALAALTLCLAACGDDLRIDVYARASGITYLALEATNEPCIGFLEVGQCQTQAPTCRQADCIDSVSVEGEMIVIDGCGERVRVPRPTTFPAAPALQLAAPTAGGYRVEWQIAEPATSIVLANGCGETCQVVGPTGSYDFCDPASDGRTASARKVFAVGDTPLGPARVWAISEDIEFTPP